MMRCLPYMAVGLLIDASATLLRAASRSAVCATWSPLVVISIRCNCWQANSFVMVGNCFV